MAFQTNDSREVPGAAGEVAHIHTPHQAARYARRYVLALARLATLMNLVHGWSSQGGPIMEKRIAPFRRQVEAHFGGRPGRGARYPLAFRASAVEDASACLASGGR